MNSGEKLTAKQATALREELAELEGPRRTEVVAAIKKAREFGDLSENFEYHAAKNEQGLLEARIRTLRARLDGAEIVEQASADEVGVGSVVDIEGDGGQKLTVEISAVGGAGTVSPTSPLGSVLLGKKVGDTVDVAGAKRRLARHDREHPLNRSHFSCGCAAQAAESRAPERDRPGGGAARLRLPRRGPQAQRARGLVAWAPLAGHAR